jgi:hypothetical protein
MDFTLTDYDGRPILIGMPVLIWCPRDQKRTGVEEIPGTVIDFGEWDGDYDDNLGRAVGYPPQITVQWWEDGGTDKFLTSEWEYEGWAWDRSPVTGMVEEVVAVEVTAMTLPGHETKED